MDLQQSAIELLQSRFPTAFEGFGEHAGQKWAYIQRESNVEALRVLRDELKFDMLMDLTAVDYLNHPIGGVPARFCMVYVLYSTSNNAYFRVKCWVPEANAEIRAVGILWLSAPWAEREVWDMFGIRFRDHGDMRRILCPFDFEGFPLRKDYPLQGLGERQNFPRFVK